jgi:hypothetical protein
LDNIYIGMNDMYDSIYKDSNDKLSSNNKDKYDIYCKMIYIDYYIYCLNKEMNFLYANDYNDFRCILHMALDGR